VQEYRSRQVGVFGAVAKPGVYSLASGKDTLSDMISLAGGATPDAASRIDFVPANPAAKGRAPTGVTPSPVIIPGSVSRATNTISIDLNDSSSRTFLALPARPGHDYADAAPACLFDRARQIGLAGDHVEFARA